MKITFKTKTTIGPKSIKIQKTRNTQNPTKNPVNLKFTPLPNQVPHLPLRLVKAVVRVVAVARVHRVQSEALPALGAAVHRPRAEQEKAELVVTSVAACAAHYAVVHAARHQHRLLGSAEVSAEVAVQPVD